VPEGTFYHSDGIKAQITLLKEKLRLYKRAMRIRDQLYSKHTNVAKAHFVVVTGEMESLGKTVFKFVHDVPSAQAYCKTLEGDFAFVDVFELGQIGGKY
jgi:hypothetical protein